MPAKTLKVGQPHVRRIYNPKTGTYYLIRMRSENKGRKDSLLGKWKPPIQKGDGKTDE